MKKIQIIAMRSWGELGNLLAAKTLAALLQELPQVEGSVIEMESLLPRFGEAGDKIAAIAKSACSPGEKKRLYHAFMDQLAQDYPPGFEIVSPPPEGVIEEISRLRAHFTHTKPDLIIGTKGIITRLCFAALRFAGLSTPVVNYITNHGLLSLAIHRSHHLPCNLVALHESRRSLIQDHGYPAERVHTVGRLIALGELNGFLERSGAPSSPAGQENIPELPADSNFRMAIFSNRGGPAYLQLLRHLAQKHPHIPLIFIGFNDPPLVEGAVQLCQDYRLDNWLIFDRLGQNRYHQYLRWLSSADYPLLISKTGPNTMLEAAYFGVPVFLLNSGLPMEAWVAPFTEKMGLGRGFQEMLELLPALDQWLEAPQRLAKAKRNAAAFREAEMDQHQVRGEVLSLFTRILNQS